MHRLRHVLWIGGPPGTGKTTIATRLARRHGLRWYGADTRTWAHRDRALAAGSPAAIRWEAMTPEERQAGTPAERLELSLHAERGPMVVDDLRRLPSAPLIVAEGSTVPAAAVSSGIADRDRALWLLPTSAFHEARHAERELPAGLAELYGLLASTIERETDDSDAPTVALDGTRGIDELLEAVEKRFAAALAEGPCAETVEERRALLREANESVVAQVRGYYARPWAEGDSEVVVRTFLCECGDTGCVAELELPVGAAAAAPVLAARHAETSR